MGWLYPGDTVPEFEREMNQLGIGGVSPVFQSRFGFHIIQVVERRQQAASEERQRQAARQAASDYGWGRVIEQFEHELATARPANA